MSICKCIIPDQKLIKGYRCRVKAIEGTNFEFCFKHRNCMKYRNCIVYDDNWEKCYRVTKQDSQYCDHHMEQLQEKGWRCCAKIRTRCKRRVCAEMQCCPTKSHLKLYYEMVPDEVLYCPIVRPDIKLTRKKWINLILIRKNTYLRQIDKFVWFEIIALTLKK